MYIMAPPKPGPLTGPKLTPWDIKLPGDLDPYPDPGPPLEIGPDPHVIGPVRGI